MTQPTCVVGGIDTYQPSEQKPWNLLRVKHLYKRLGFGLSHIETTKALSKNPSVLVDEILDVAIEASTTPAPPWINTTRKDYDTPEEVNEVVRSMMSTWVQDILQENIRGKFILFWHNHFVTQLELYYFPTYIYQYHQILQTKAFGNFKEFVYEIGKSPAMLLFLNGIENTKVNPNENYARELFELFTLGQDNGYSQTDIEEAARALTGWNQVADFGAPITFSEWAHDKGIKILFGQTGRWGYDDLHEILFEERKDQIAQFICQKIYTHFVNPHPDSSIITNLADTLLENDWELAPVYRRLFKSEHFFDQANINILVKSPYAFYLNFFNDLDAFFSEDIKDSLFYFTGMLGQQLGSPIDVAGWKGNRGWLDTARMSGRWRTLGYYIYDTFNNSPESLGQLAYHLTGNETESDASLVVQKVIDHFIPTGIHTPETYERALAVFKADIPQNYFEDGSWSIAWDTIHWQMTLLVLYIIRLPEFQLS